MDTYIGYTITKRENEKDCSVIQLYKGDIIIGIGATKEQAQNDLFTKIIIKESEKSK